MPVKSSVDKTNILNLYQNKNLEIKNDIKLNEFETQKITKKHSYKNITLKKHVAHSKLPNCLDFIKELFKIPSKLKYTDHIDIWKGLYVHITNDDLELNEIKKYYDEKHNLVINSVNNSKIFLEHMFEQFNDKTKNETKKEMLNVIFGQKGCGKSAFIKQLIIKNTSSFSLKNIIPSRVEYSKVINELKSNSKIIDYTNHDAILAATKNNFCRDAIKFLFASRLYCNDTDIHAITTKYNDNIFNFENAILNFNQDLMLNHPDSDNKINAFNWFSEFYDKLKLSTDKSQINTQIKRIQRFKKIQPYFLEMCINSLNANFIAIYDGFDLVTVQDFLNNNDKEKLITDIVHHFKSDNVIREWLGFKYDRWLIIREETYSRIAIHDISSRGKVQEYTIVPPPFSKIKRRYIKLLNTHFDLSEDKEKNKISFDLYFDALEKMFKELLNINNIEDIFNGNVRQYKYFIKSAIVLSYFILPSEQLWKNPNIPSELTLDDIINKYEIFEIKSNLYIKFYRFSFLFIIRKIDVVANRTLFKKNNLINDSGEVYGIFDNIFNYSNKSNDLSVLIQKARVLLILKKTNHGHNSKEISDEFSRIYSTSTINLDDDLNLLCRVGYIASNFGVSNEKVFYKITPRGLYLIEYFLFNLVYFENLLPNCLLPNKLQNEFHMIDDGHEEYRKLKKYNIIQFLRNAYVLLMLIREIERKDNIDSEYLLGDKICENISEEIIRILNNEINNNNTDTVKNLLIVLKKAESFLQIRKSKH